MPNVEIERRFVIDSINLNLAGYKGEHIEQGYLSNASRIRRITSHKIQTYYHTEKSGSGLIRKESEHTISQKEFLTFWPQTEGRRISKIRYSIPVGEYIAEVDVFGGELSGHCIVEVEFPSEVQALSFIVPDWFLAGDKCKEVTENSRYSNYSLALYGWPKAE